MIKLENIKQYNIKEILTINSDIEIQEKNIDGLNYVVIDNFLKNPNHFIDFLKQFPTDHTYCLLEQHYESKETCPFIKPPGIQQLLPNSYFEFLSVEIYKILVETNFIPENNAENTRNIQKLSKIIRSFVYYTNIFFPNMVCNKNSELPHIDQFDYSFNIHLNKDVGGGLSFYKLFFADKYYSSVEDIMKLTDSEIKSSIADNLNVKCAITEDIIKYKQFDGDEMFVKYHTIPYKFNRLVLYKGSNWHNIEYNSQIETNIRYSLAGCFTELK